MERQMVAPAWDIVWRVANCSTAEARQEIRAPMRRQGKASGANFYLRRFLGNLGFVIRSCQCDTVVRFARAARGAGLVLSKGAAEAGASGCHRTPALIWHRMLLSLVTANEPWITRILMPYICLDERIGFSKVLLRKKD